MQNLFIWLKVCCVLSSVESSEESQLWVVVGGSEKNRLWCVTTGMSDKQCHSKCSEWPPSALTHTSSLFRHWNSSHVATSRCRKPQHVRAPPAACPRRSTRAMQIIWNTKQYTVIHNYGNPYEKWNIFVARPHLWLQLGMVKPEIMLYETVLNLSTLNTLTYLRILTAWDEMDQRIIDAAIRQWRTRLRAWIKAIKGGHFEHTLTQ